MLQSEVQVKYTSCLLKYVTSEFQTLEDGAERKLVVWSDRCTGQNNNWKTIALYQYLVSLKYFSSVEQKFLVTGHSFLPCDRDFALIERNKKNCVVYVPFQWVEVIANARISNNFLVYYMYQEDFVDLQIILAGIFRNPACKITDYVWLKISCDSPTVLQCRKSHNLLQPWISSNLGKRRRGKGDITLPPVTVPLSDLPPLYDGELSLSEAKIKDLLDICRYIPPPYRTFYENLKADKK